MASSSRAGGARRTTGRAACVTLAGGAIALIALAAPRLATWLEYDRAAVAGGEIWRIPGCHLAHFGVEHALYSVGVFLLVGAICEVAGRWQFLLAMASASVAIPLTLFVLQPELTSYRGLSGLDSALFALLIGSQLACADRLGGRELAMLGALAAFAAKITFEATTGATVFADTGESGFEVVPLAHVIGGACGLVVAFSLRPSPVPTPS